jgi:hypothetical protein
MIHELPNYFLADLPPEPPLAASTVTEACRTLRRNRAKYLADRSTADMVRSLSRLGADWLDPEFSFRQTALGEGPAATGFSRETLEAGLDAFFRSVTPESLNTLLLQELGHVERLDGPVQSDFEWETGRAAMAVGPELIVHIAGGVLPNPVFTSMIHGLLVRSAQFVKCASGTAFLPRLFAHSIYQLDSKLASCLEVAEWRGGSETLEHALFAEADIVTAMGSDETLEALRSRVPGKLLGHGHRASFGYATLEAVSGLNVAKLITRAAEDVAAWDQLGCLSPHVIYVEGGGKVTPEQFAERLVNELKILEGRRPRGSLSTEAAAALAIRRSVFEIRASQSAETRLWTSSGTTAWTVVFEAEPVFSLSCGHRFIFVKPAPSLTEVLRQAEMQRGKISTVGLAATEDRAPVLVRELARWGVTRVCPLGEMQNPPLTWRHDGRPALGDLVTWVDWEQG